MNLIAADLKKGTVFRHNGEIYMGLDWQRRVAGRQKSVIAIKAINLRTNKTISQSFRENESFESVAVRRRLVQFLYHDERCAYFMDPETYDQYHLERQRVQEQIDYMSENLKTIMVIADDQPLTIELPKNVWLPVKTADPAVRGDTTGAVLKDAITETGLKVKVPSFIKAGDIISVDTATGNYRERQKDESAA